MYSNQAFNQYRDQSVLTAGPGELVLMLYDGCLKQIRLARLAIEEKLLEQKNSSLMKAQSIVSELMATLNFDYKISDSLYALYDYFLNELITANIDLDTKRLDNVENMLGELRDTWEQMIKQQKTGGGGTASI
ncbi:MAG: flagellar secretion chaperone FliS [Clostridiales bacterium]|nr:flagellar secretion chaperone FliS [Clostridiales bacterium]